MHRFRLLFLVVAVSLIAACTGEHAPAAPPETFAAMTSLPATSAAPTPTTVPPESMTIPPAPDLGDAATICDTLGDPVTIGTVANPSVRETSGIVASRAHPGILWAHNDSGDEAAVYAVSTDGTDQGTFVLEDVFAFDWEDIALGPGPDPDRDYLYVGDIGDNLTIRDRITVYRFVEPTPDPAGAVVRDVEKFDLAYPDPAPDSEAIAVDPLTGDLLVITKPVSDGISAIYRAAAATLDPGAIALLEPVGSFDAGAGNFVTGADVDGTGSVVAFRGYTQVWMWLRTDLTFVATFSVSPCEAPSPDEIQGEAIAFEPGGFGYYTISEGTGAAVHYVAGS